MKIKMKKKRKVMLLGEARQTYHDIRRLYKLYVTIATGKGTTFITNFPRSPITNYLGLFGRSLGSRRPASRDFPWALPSGNHSEQPCTPLGFFQTDLGKIAMGLLGKILYECCPFSYSTFFSTLLYCNQL